MRKLFEDERELIAHALRQARIAQNVIIDEALDHCVLHARQPRLGEITGGLRSALAHLALRGRAAAIALGDHVFIRASIFDAEARPPLWLVAHEVTHVVQYRRDGSPTFVYRYVRDYLRGRVDGLGDMAAYRAISYEKEARRVADLTRTQPEEIFP